MFSPVTKILIDGPAWVGDMVMAQSLFKLLHQRHPNVTIDVLAPDSTKPLLAFMPEVANALTLPCLHGELALMKRYRLARKLRQQRYDWTILTRNSLKSALIPFCAGIPRRTGWQGEWRFGFVNDMRKLDKSQYPRMIERFIALGLKKEACIPKPYLLPSLTINRRQRDATLQKFALGNPAHPVLVLCPGAAYGPAKRWPAEYFAEVAKAKLAEGWQVWLLGSKAEQSITERINALCQQRAYNLAGKTKLAEALNLLSTADLVVSNDSGLMHVAAALQRKLIVVYGSTSANFSPPLTEQARALSLKLSCSPCCARQCQLGHLKCLRELTPKLVLKASHELLCSNSTGQGNICLPT